MNPIDLEGTAIPLFALPTLEAAAKLREFGEDETAEALESAAVDVMLPPAGEVEPSAFGLLHELGPSRARLYLGRSHVFGYVAPAAPGGGLLEIRHAGNISPDNSLRGNPVVVRLDHLHIAAYPGGGTHHVLFDFAAQHETERGSERLHFAMTSEVGEGEEAAILGLPIFVGLQVGSEGLDFQCRTGARLAEGSYFAVQVPSERKAVWDWAEWAFDMGRGQVVNRGQRSRLLPYNYVAFSVCRPMALAR
jgi:hypothetical protein